VRFSPLKGLRSEILGNLSLVCLIALLSTGIGVWWINGRQLLEQELYHGRALVKALTDEILDTLPSDHPIPYLETRKGKASLQFLLDRCREKDPRLQITLVDPYFRVLASTNKKKTQGTLRRVDSTLSLSFLNRTPSTRLDGKAPFLGIYHQAVMSLPLERDGMLLGGLLVRLSLEDVLNSAGQTVTFILLYMGMGTLVLLLFGTILLSRTLVRPLVNMILVMKKVADGDLDQRVDSSGENELGSLAETFNVMAEKLQGNERAIHEHLNALQKMNRELKQSQQEVIHSEKLASVGLLAAGVAHEIGNPLGAILGYINILESGVEDEKEQRDFLQRAETEILRIHRIVEDLREYSKPSPCKLSSQDVNQVIRETIQLVSRQREFQRVRFDLSLAASIPSVHVDQGQLQQVLVNLFLNAKDAMEQEGSIRIATQQVCYRAPKDPAAGEASCRRDDPQGVDFRLLRKNNPARDWPFLEGQEVVQIQVSDTGSGIREEQILRVFDPFFTTKETGQGTGLGLSVSLRIIESFHGTLQINSRQDDGTQVIVRLPALESTQTVSPDQQVEEARDGAVCSDRR